MDFIYWTVLIISLIYSKWRDSENQQMNFIGVFWFHFLAKCCKFHRVSSQAIWSFCWHFFSIHVLIVNSFSCFSNFEQACDKIETQWLIVKIASENSNFHNVVTVTSFLSLKSNASSSSLSTPRDCDANNVLRQKQKKVSKSLCNRAKVQTQWVGQ